MGVLDILINAFIVTRFIPFWTPIYYAILAYGCYLVYRMVLFAYNQYHLQKDVIRNGEMTCVQALASVMENCLDNIALNAVTFFVLDAIKMAKEWDNHANEAGFERPPLFGIPISVKESTMVKGYALTFGFITRADKKAERHSITIQKLVNKGAIPFCLSNVPQTLLTFHCNNPVFGLTTNPHREGRTCGGSSGGEGALVGGKMSYVGIGSDVGGSIRIPSHFCGAVGVKPGGTRLSRKDCISSLPGRPLVDDTEGPIGQTVEACVDVFSNLVDYGMPNADPYAPPVPWRQEIFLNGKKDMTIGYYLHDGWFEPCPAVKNAVLKAVDCLKEQGYNLVEFQPPDSSTAFSLMFGVLSVDGGYLVDAVSRDLLLKEYIEVLGPFTLPSSIRMLLAHTVGRFVPRARTLLSFAPASTSDLRQMSADIQSYRKRFIEEMKKQNIDLILCPPNAGLAYRLPEPLKLYPTISYTTLFNLLDFPAGVLPVRSCTEEDIENMKHYEAHDPWERLFKDSMSDPKLVGMSVNVQVAGPPFSEELIFHLMKCIEEGVNKH